MNGRNIVNITETDLQNSVGQHRRQSIKQDDKIPSLVMTKNVSEQNKCNVNIPTMTAAILKIRFEMLNAKRKCSLTQVKKQVRI